MSRRRTKLDRRLLTRPLVSFERLEDREVPATAFALAGTSLLTFDTASPTVTQTTPITGVTSGEALVGIDVRPQNGYLYGLGVDATADTATLYAISPRTGQAAAIGTPSQIAFDSTDLPDPTTAGYGFDFNPLADRIRVTTSTGLNFRVNPNTGAPFDADGVAGAPITPDAALSGGTTSADGAAYTNSEPNPTVTALYLLDAASDSLYVSTNPNGGTTAVTGLPVTVGGTPIDFTVVNGFDIGNGVDTIASNTPVLAGTGYATLTVGGTTSLYSIDLATGAATVVGAVGAGTGDVSGLALRSDAAGLPSVALDASGPNLIRFNTATPGTGFVTQAISGIPAAETLVGIDYRPATGQLVGLGIDPTADTGTLYVIDPQTGAASVLVAGAAGKVAFVDGGGAKVELPDPATTGYGFDFNPTVDRIRVTTSSGLNFRLNPTTGGVSDGDAAATGNQTDPNVNGLPGGSTGVSAAAYTNSFGGATTTTLYTLDAASNTLFIQNSTGGTVTGPNGGGQSTPVPVTLGGAALDFSDVNGFDIPSGVGGTTANAVAAGLGYAVLTVGGATSLYRIDLTTGVATAVGAVGTATDLAGLALGEGASGTVSFATATVSVSEAGPTATINLTRTGSTAGAVTVTVNVTGGTATAGTDFTAGPYTATFADGSATASFTIPVVDDAIFEGNETVLLTIAGAGGAAVGTPNKATLTITENDPQQSFTVGAAVGYALSGGTLIPFASSNPAAAGTPIPVTGVDAAETLVAIDFRPQNGVLYGLGVNAAADMGTLYAISTVTGVAAPVGGATAVGAIAFTTGGGTAIDLPDPATTNYDIDFNPAADRLRVVAGGLNFRVDPNTGLPVDGDTGVAATGTQTDGNINGPATAVGGTAYTNSFPNNGNTTTQYTLDAATDSLYVQNAPNGGTQTLAKPVTVNGTPINFTAVRGFDILADVTAPASNAAVTAGTGLAVLTVGGVDTLYRIDLATGAATAVGGIGATPATVDSIAFLSDLGATPVIALNAAGTALARSLSNTVANPVTVGITGVAAGEQLVGIDFRPQTGQLFAFGVNATADTGTVYRLDPQTGAATAIGATGSIAFVDTAGTTIDLPDPATAGYGFDFNPTVDRIRITSSTGLNARANPDTGLPVDGNGATGTQPDGTLNGTGVTGASGTAYTNAYGQSLVGGVTTQYSLDATTDSLYVQTPNTGALANPLPITVGGTKIDFTDVNGFNIPASVGVTASGTAVTAGSAFATLTVGGASGLYQIDLTTGAATLLGTAAAPLAGLATADTPTGGIVEFTAATFTVTEAGTTGNLTLTRTGGSAGPLTVTVTLTPGTATSPADFDATPITVTFADGQTTATVAVPIVQDNTLESPETFTATLGGVTNGGFVGAVGTATVTITDAPPTVSVADAKVTEGNAGTATLTFTVTLSGPSSQTVTVTADTADGTATAGTDYVALTGQVITFAPGETSKTISVTVNGDTVFEGDETFTVTLSNATNATLAATPTATGTITDDDTAPVISVSNVTAAEGNSGTMAFTFTVSLANASGTPVTVTVNTADGTATAGTDYTAVSGLVLTFAPGETSKTVTVDVTGDTRNEADESFTVNLSAASGGTVATGATGTGTGTIQNDDAAPTLSIDNVAKREGNSGTTAYTFTVTLSGASDQTVTVSVATANNTATGGSDFAALAAQTLTFAPGETTKTVTVLVNGDTTVEADETFFVTLSGQTVATLATAQGIGTIVNDDAAVTPSKTLLVGSSVTAVGAGSGTPTVRLIAADGTQISSAAAFGSGFTGGVRTAVADVNGDGTPDVIVGSGPGTASLVRVLDGKTGAELFSVAPFEASFTGGVFVAAGDVNGDGTPDIIISPDQGGGPRVDIYSGKNFDKIDSFFGIDDPNFRGGARVAVGDINGDGVGDLLVAAGFLGGPRVAGFDGKSLGTTSRVKLFNDFFAFEASLRNGAFVTLGDVNGDGKADIIAGGGPSGGPRVIVIDSAQLLSTNGGTVIQLANFFAGDTTNRLGVQVAAKDVDGDSKADIRTVVGGSDTIVTYLGKDLTANTQPTGTSLDGLPDFNGGVFIG